MLYVILSIIIVGIIPAIVTALEYNHYWTKLYNWAASLINSTGRFTKLKILPYKSGPNSTEHQKKTYLKWLLIGIIGDALLIALLLIIKYW